MLLDVCFGSKSAWRILALFGESPGAGFTRQDCRKHTKLGNKALSAALKRLVAFGILIKSKGQLSLAVYKLNQGNPYVRDLLSLLQRELTGLNHLPYSFGAIAREFSREVIDSVDAHAIYLFGSVAKGTYRDDSDIDFAVVLEDKTPSQDMILNTIADKLSRKSNRKIQCFPMTHDQMAKRGLAVEILKHGIRLV